MANKSWNTKDVTVPLNGYTVYAKRFWICKDGDPKQALFYDTSPECNTNKIVVEMRIKRIKEKVDFNLVVVYIDIAFVKKETADIVYIEHFR